MNDILWFFIAASGPCALAISIYTAVRFFRVVGSIREESKKSYEVANRLDSEYEILAGRVAENRRRIGERFDELEAELRVIADRAEKTANGTRDRLIRLEKYLKDFFEIELKSVFDSFDKTVASVLEEMKAELLRGVDRIEEIQAVVESRSFAQERIMDGEDSVYRMISERSGGDADNAPADEEERGRASGRRGRGADSRENADLLEDDRDSAT